jgi:hypothetical protein
MSRLRPREAHAAPIMVVRFPEPDSAYLVHASLRQQLDAVTIAGVFVVPSDEGPALECGSDAWEHELVQELVLLFDGEAVDAS